MKFVDNSVTEYIQEPGIEGVYKSVVSAARICYQTDKDKMKLSPKEFVEQVLLKNGHTRPLEFGTVYLKVYKLFNVFKYQENKYSVVKSYYDDSANEPVSFITTNLRVLMQGDYETDEEAFHNNYDKNWLSDLKFLCEPTEHHERRRTFTMVMSRGCTDDNRTHIELSSICESTRWCNYSKNKFGNEMTFIWPYWIDKSKMEDFNNCKGELYEQFKEMMQSNITFDRDKPEATTLVKYALDEANYMDMVGEYGLGYQPQQGKRFFPLGGKAELRLCGFDNAWTNFFWRRCDDHADPECIIVANKIKELYYADTEKTL